MSTPEVDVIVAVHDDRRPIERAVGSVLDGTRAQARVTVVAHGVAPTSIAQRLGPRSDDPRVRVVPFRDGIRSPSGPFNAGLDLATAPFTSVLGSDDTYEHGAIDSWLALAAKTHADVVIARLRKATGRAVPMPPTRPCRSTALDGVRDRLSYRSAPLGLVSTQRFGTLRFAAGRPVGEDVPYVTQMWFAGARIAFARTGPAYLLHEDVPGRTTVTRRSISAELGYLHDVVDAPWFADLPTPAKEAFCIKALRMHVFGAVTNRAEDAWGAVEREALASHASVLLRHGNGIERVLSRRDRALLDAISDPRSSTNELLDAARRRRSFAAPGSLLPRRLRDAFHREAPLRMMAAAAAQSF